MIQILQTDLNEEKAKKIHKKKLSNFFKIQLYVSTLLFFSLTSYFIYYRIKLNNEEKYSSHILNNYNVSLLYSTPQNNESNYETSFDINQVLGIIDIPSLNIYYPIFANYNDELLKISPCRFYGPSPGRTGNLCIAGHNYDNDKFFSKIGLLKNGDIINLYNNVGKSFSYYVSSVYEVKENDLSPIYDYNENKKQITLVTCNNINKNRIIVKAFAN